MNFIIDEITKSVLLETKLNYFIHILPVTKYQMQDYIKQSSSLLINKDKIINKLDVKNLNTDNIIDAFATHINFEEAGLFSKWVGGRLPTLEEWELNYVNYSFDLFERALCFCEKFKSDVDNRLLILLKTLIKVGIKRTFLSDKIGEIVTQYKDINYYGKLYLKFSIDKQAEILGDPPSRTRQENFGFYYIIED